MSVSTTTYMDYTCDRCRSVLRLGSDDKNPPVGWTVVVRTWPGEGSYDVGAREERYNFCPICTDRITEVLG